MKLARWILVLAVLGAPAPALCDEIKGAPPEQWLECFAATKLHQEALAASGKVSLAIILRAGEPRVAYQKLASHYLTGFKKMNEEAASGEMVRAPADMKKTKTMSQIEDLAQSCVRNLPDLANPMFYQKYPFLGD